MTITESNTLSEQHQALLDDSAINAEVAEQRGYFSAKSAAQLSRLGFASYQCNTPSLVIPSWGVDGTIVNYQARPDRPRVDPERGREVKYETVAGSTIRLDVPPACRDRIGRTIAPLWITEGIRKGDSLASHGLCAVALLGVDCFRTDDWDRVALDERNAYIAFDSDAMTKRSVHGALERLAKMLTSKGATVHYVYLPEGDGKIGVDDYLGAGHTVEELCALAEPELRDPPAEGTPHRPSAWPTSTLLWGIERLLRRYVKFPSEHESAALSLYVLHSWALPAAQATPYVLIVSPEKRAGKTRTLEVIELIVREPLRAASISAAGLFQSIAEWTPTLLVDELDATFHAKSEQAEALRGVLNAGNRRGSYVVRGSQEGKPVKFDTFCCKVMAGINNGRVPDTVRDRSIILGIERKRPDETVEDLFPADLAEPLEELRGRLEDWAAEHHDTLAAWRRSERIRELDDRLQESWDPLLGIADLAGAGWPERAKAAAIALTKTVDPGDAEHGHLLLTALRATFDANGAALASKTICDALNENEELPFGGYGDGTGIKPRGLAKLLKPYGVKPKVVRVGNETPRGYHRDDFDQAWQRYAPTEEPTPAKDPAPEAQQAQHPQHPSPDGNGHVADVADVALFREALAHAHTNHYSHEEDET